MWGKLACLVGVHDCLNGKSETPTSRRTKSEPALAAGA